MSAAPVIPFATTYRTHTCGELRAPHAGATVTLCGQVDKYLDENTLDLRDAYGKTRVKLDEKAVAALDKPLMIAEWPADKRPKRPPLESVIRVTGTVKARDEADEKSLTGAVYLEASDGAIVSPAKAGLVFDPNDEKLPPRERLRHRYMYLRKSTMHENIRFRTRVVGEMRKHLLGKGFEEVHTPVLATKFTPDQYADGFLSLRARTEIYGLPGRRWNLGEVLMASGFDRTFEYARRFQRLKSYGPFRQPEFSVLEMNMAWVDESDLVTLAIELLTGVWKTAFGESVAP
ncbi:MAG TPA: amino acid--tRNA ligase-related protein, partial [Planctomycetota bacterium]|nr:amino acid--tRNA ligase-related protein [Planctomycetota bacterium]